MKSIKVSAPGKIHLLGEHSVVYGKPALLAAVNKRVFVEITLRKDNKREIIIKDVKNKKIFDYVNFAIETTARFYKKVLPKGFTVTITSQIPLGAGMGSSAASAVSIAGAITLLLKEKFDREKINDIAFLIEKYNHANPSGGDNTASCYGGFIWYRKETQELKFIKSLSFSLSKELKKNFYIVNTGTPKESTKEMVRSVQKFVKKNKKSSEKIFAAQEELTKDLLLAFQHKNENEIIRIIKNGERNLEKLGVVSVSVKKLIRYIEKLGGAAKICGGGGKINGTGILLIYQKTKLVKYDTIQLGEKGIRIEK